MRLADHQRRAAERVGEVMAEHGGVLLADEAGLGKSLVAAAVMARFPGKVELIVPVALVPQWMATLSEAGVEATVLTHDSLAGLPFVPDPSRMRLVVVDEAHAFRNPRTQRYDALCRRSVGANVLMVTATPVCNSARDLQALLSLLVADDALVSHGVASMDAAFATRDPIALQAIVAALVIRRDRSVLPEELKFALAVRRVIRYPLFDAGGAVTAIIDALEFPLIGSAPLLRRTLWRRLESSEAALMESIRRQLRFYDRALDGLAHGRVLSKREYRRAFGGEEDGDPIQQVLFWELWAAPSTEVGPDRIREETHRLSALLGLVERSPCEKRRLLVAQLARIDEPAIVFTTAAATARDVHDAMRAHCRAAVATSRDGRGAIDAFCSGRIDVLVATDLASEGLNLQRAGAIVHYDIPWNPVKLDQRNGRACRIGQTRNEVAAIYFLPETNVTGIVSTMAAKNRVRRRLIRAEARGGALERDGVPDRTLPARLVHDAAAVKFLEAVERRGLLTPRWLERRHKAGIDRLLAAASREYIDRTRLDDLLAMIGGERT